MVLDELPLHLIDSDEQRDDRFSLDPDDLQALADSIARLGLINPITVQPNHDRYTLVAGRRRLEAHHLLGRSHIRASALPADTPSLPAIGLAENLVRADLTPVEEARAVDRLSQQTEHPPEQLAIFLHRSVPWIRHRLALADYPGPILEALHIRAISLGVADELALIVDAQQRDALLAAAVANGCTARQASLWRQHANALLTDPTAANTQPTPPPVAGPPPVVSKQCWGCSRQVPITAMSYVCLCGDCSAGISAALQRLGPTTTEGPPPPKESST